VPEVGASSPVAPAPAHCPVDFVAHGALHANAKGIVHVDISCPLGCPFAELSIAKPTALGFFTALVSRVPPSRTVRESLRLARPALRYLRRHRRVRATLVALSPGLGSARETRYTAHVTLSG
jgi:hypothetical protein